MYWEPHYTPQWRDGLSRTAERWQETPQPRTLPSGTADPFPPGAHPTDMTTHGWEQERRCDGQSQPAYRSPPFIIRQAPTAPYLEAPLAPGQLYRALASARSRVSENRLNWKAAAGGARRTRLSALAQDHFRARALPALPAGWSVGGGASGSLGGCFGPWSSAEPPLPEIGGEAAESAARACASTHPLPQSAPTTLSEGWGRNSSSSWTLSLSSRRLLGLTARVIGAQACGASCIPPRPGAAVRFSE